MALSHCERSAANSLSANFVTYDATYGNRKVKLSLADHLAEGPSSHGCPMTSPKIFIGCVPIFITLPTFIPNGKVPLLVTQL